MEYFALFALGVIVGWGMYDCAYWNSMTPLERAIRIHTGKSAQEHAADRVRRAYRDKDEGFFE